MNHSDRRIYKRHSDIWLRNKNRAWRRCLLRHQYSRPQQWEKGTAASPTSAEQGSIGLTIAINSVMDEVGIQTENLPPTDTGMIRKELRDKKLKS